MSSLFNKKVRRNYRSKAEQSDDESLYEPESLYEQGSKGIICGTTGNTPTVLKKNRSTLSFEDDLDPDDGNVIHVKKPSLTRRASKPHKEHKKRHADEEIVKIVNKIEPVEKPVDHEPLEDSEEAQRKLEALRRQLLDMSEDKVDDASKKVDNSSNSTVSKSAIPDAATIHLARKQREKAKILMESAELASETQESCSNGRRRLVREEDEDDEDDFDAADDDIRPIRHPKTHERRHAFVVSDERDTLVKRPGIVARLNRRQAELESIRQDFLATEHGSDAENSDQETDWERQQIQKALITQNPAVLEAIQPVSRMEDSEVKYKSAPVFAGLDPSNVTLANLKSILLEKYKELYSSFSTHEKAHNESKIDLDRGRQVIAECRAKLPAITERFSFAHDMKSYVDDLIECFNEKMPKLNYLERRIIILYRERYTRLTQRRRLDMKDMAELATQGPNQSSTQEDPKLVEARRRRCTERESRRIRRQRARATATTTRASSTTHEEGTSTDDEEPQAVIAKRNADIESYLVDANSLFEDVVEDFYQLPLILQRFAEWRSEFPQLYADAYVALCFPQLFSPIIRMQLLSWNPLLGQSISFDKMDWFRDLLDYVQLPEPSSKANDTDRSSSSDGDANADLKLLPLVVEKVIVDKLTELVSASWDPLSHTESARLISVVQSLCMNYPTVCVGSKSTEALFSAIVKRLEATIQDDIFIPLYSKHLMQNRQGPAFQFFERQFRICLKMLRNVLLWHDLLDKEILQHISLTCLVNRYLLVGLASLLTVATSTDEEDQKPPPPPPGGVSFFLPNSTNPGHMAALAFQDTLNYLERIVSVIPITWLLASSANDDPTDGLSQLKRFVKQLIERCPGTAGRFSSSDLEREWLSTLHRLKDKLY